MSRLREIRVHPAPTKVVKLLAMSVAFVLAGLWLTGAIGGYDARYGAFDAIIGYAAIGFFGPCACYFVFRLLVRRPALVLHDDGIVDNASALSAGPISWDEVTDVGVTSYHSQRFLVLQVRDEAALLARQALLKRLLMRVNKRLGGALVWMPMQAIPMPEQELLAEIGRRYTAR